MNARSILNLGLAVAIATLVAGCVYEPAPYYGPGYYAYAPGYYAPPPTVGVGIGFGRGWHDHDDWHEHYQQHWR